MMDRPSGAELLAEARRLLLRDLLELLPPDRRYDVRMIANAMAIAAREIEAGDGPLRTALRDLAALYGAPVDPDAPLADVGRRYQELNRRLAADIRRGAFDEAGPRRDAVRDYLRTVTLLRLRLSNPKALPDDPMAQLR